MIFSSYLSRQKRHLPAETRLLVGREMNEDVAKSSTKEGRVTARRLEVPSPMIEDLPQNHPAETSSERKEAPGTAGDELLRQQMQPSSPSSNNPTSTIAAASTAMRLPDKIMAILLSEEAPDAIWWLQKGTAFAMQKEKFQEKILDKHFRGNKFKSLVRNLHRWGFKRMTCDSSASGKTIAFSHRCFQKDKPELVKLVQITKEKDNSALAAAAAADKIRGQSRSNHNQGAVVAATALSAPAAAVARPVSAPAALRLPSALQAGSLLREETSRILQYQDAATAAHAGGRSAAMTTATGSSNSPTLTSNSNHHLMQPSLHSMAAAEHHHNLTSHGPESLIHSLSDEWTRSNPQDRMVSGIRPLSSGLGSRHGSITGQQQQQQSCNLAFSAAARGHERSPPSPRRFLGGSSNSNTSHQLQQRLESLLQAEEETVAVAAAQQRQRDAFMLQQLASLPSDARNRLLLQQRLGLPSSVTNQSLFQGAAGGTAASSSGHSLLMPPVSSQYRHYLSQLSSGPSITSSSGQQQQHPQQAGFNIEQAMLLGRAAAAAASGQTRSPWQGTGMGIPSLEGRAPTPPNPPGLTAEELSYLAELRRRRDSSSR